MIFFFLFVFTISWLYANSLIGVKEEVKVFYKELKKELRQQNFGSNIFVISGRRWKLDNYILTKFNNAASKSRHKKGEAIDIIVFDINQDGKSDEKDVNIVYQILDKRIIRDKGGLGTYKNSKGFLNQQMVHFDCRGKRVRWNN